MDKNQAQKIIRDTFENSFDKNSFTGFIKNLLNRVDDAPFTYQGNYIPDAYKQYIKTLERIGKFSDGENNIDILVITLQKETSLERARTRQRNFVAWYLNGSRGGKMKDAALVAYVSPDGTDWRFSLVKMDYKFEKTSTGKMKVKEEFTPARRWSFLVGANEKSHTAQSRLINILANDEPAPTLEEIEKAFDIETVTKEFFLKYRELFLRTKEELDRVVKNDPKIKADFESKGVDTVNFAKKLLGQIVFLYFLQKKGWFGVSRDDDWGTGSKHFLRELFEKKHCNYNNFINDILEPLFYEALRTGEDRKHEDYYYSRFNCKIPFLNGGLFDPIGNYDWVHTDIHLPDNLFSNTNKTKEGDVGDGILDIFDRYNFTVKEDEPLEKEVAIDPELLGKTYEKFNAIRPDNYEEFKRVLKSGKTGEENKFNKKFGVYYTPREIVHYMCRQSLIDYLYSELNEHKQFPVISREDIETLIHTGAQVSENEARVLRKGKETKTYSHQLPESIRKNAKRIDDKLVEITVCDPAVGSGAFPVGMMSEIVKARTVLSTFIEGKENRTPYEFKRRCIEHSLYGVDIDPGAVEIAKLRLWLSLVVDEDDIKNIKPLPNLDYKVVCGNSLLGVEENLFNNQFFNELEKIKPLYFNETNPTQKQEYKKQIDKLISQITNGHKEFDFEVYFSEIFHNKGGFDVVIANPPYVSYGLRGGQKMTEHEKEFLRKNFPNSAEYKISLYAIFMDKGLQIVKPGGGLATYIVPDSFLLGRYFSKIRKFILRTSEIIYILLLPFSVFEATVGFSVVYLFQRKQVVNLDHQLTASFARRTEDVGGGDFKVLSYPQDYFNNQKFKRFRLFFDEKAMALISKFEKGSVEIGSVVRFSSGLISKTGQKNIISEEKKSDKWEPGIVSGSEIKHYAIIPDGYYILYDNQKIKSGYGNVDYFSNKIFMRQTGDSLVCAFDDRGLLALNNVHIGNKIGNDICLKFVTALLNSRALNFYYRTISLETDRVMAQTDIETIETLPVKSVTLQEQQPFIELVDKILAITKDDDYLENPIKQANVREYEKQIDQMVYQLYGLTEEEIAIIEDEKK